MSLAKDLIERLLSEFTLQKRLTSYRMMMHKYYN